MTTAAGSLCSGLRLPCAQGLLRVSAECRLPRAQPDVWKRLELPNGLQLLLPLKGLPGLAQERLLHSQSQWRPQGQPVHAKQAPYFPGPYSHREARAGPASQVLRRGKQCPVPNRCPI